jgi:pilus assembly protein CpaE
MFERNSPKPSASQPVLAVSPDRKLMSELVPLLSQLMPAASVVEMNQFPDRKLIAEMARSEKPSLIFLDVANFPQAGLETLANVASGLSGVPVVALLRGNDPDLILRCLRTGASEFLLQPLTADQLQPILARIVQKFGGEGAAGGARVQLVMPVKGACGASTLASNLVFQWKNHGFKRSLLADLDPATGTIPFLLKLKSSYSFLDAITRDTGLDADIWRGLVNKRGDVDVLLSPENPVDVENEAADPRPLFDFARQAYDIITVDCAGPYGRWSSSLAHLADEILLVTTNELPALRSAQRVLQQFDRTGIDRDKVRLIVNRFSSDVGLNQDAIETALHADVYHVIPSDYEAVQDALVEGKPASPSSSFGKSLAQLANRLSGKKSAPDGAKKKSSIGSLFSSLVSRVTN